MLTNNKDRRFISITIEMLSRLLALNNIYHLEINHKTNTVDIYFNGDGSMQIPEGGEACKVSHILPNWYLKNKGL